ncbi:MAG: hypothetical protein ACE5EB_01920 [Thermodesulfobacteriota bacterium]
MEEIEDNYSTLVFNATKKDLCGGPAKQVSRKLKFVLLSFLRNGKGEGIMRYDPL